MAKCEAPGKKVSFAPGDWNGWSVESDNSRYQAKPGLNAADIPRLKLKWAFGFPGDTPRILPTDRCGRPRVRRQHGRVGLLAGRSYRLRILELQSRRQRSQRRQHRPVRKPAAVILHTSAICTRWLTRSMRIAALSSGNRRWTNIRWRALPVRRFFMTVDCSSPWRLLKKERADRLRTNAARSAGAWLPLMARPVASFGNRSPCSIRPRL